MDDRLTTSVLGFIRGALAPIISNFVDKLHDECLQGKDIKLSRRHIDKLELIVLERIKDGRQFIILNEIGKLKAQATMVVPTKEVIKLCKRELTLVRRIFRQHPKSSYLKGIDADLSRCLARKCAGVRRVLSRKQLQTLKEMMDRAPGRYSKRVFQMFDVIIRTKYKWQLCK